MSKKKQELIKIWYIKNSEGVSYWSDVADYFKYEFEAMGDGKEFTIRCHELTKREFNKLAKNSHEFDGW